MTKSEFFEQQNNPATRVQKRTIRSIAGSLYWTGRMMSDEIQRLFGFRDIEKLSCDQAATLIRSLSQREWTEQERAALKERRQEALRADQRRALQVDLRKRERFEKQRMSELWEEHRKMAARLQQEKLRKKAITPEMRKRGRLHDWIRDGNYEAPQWLGARRSQYLQMVDGALADGMPTLSYDDVTEWLGESGPYSTNGCIPPFPVMFTESAYRAQGDLQAWGHILRTKDLKSDSEWLARLLLDRKIPPRTRWIVEALLFIDDGGEKVHGPLLRERWYLDESGNPLRTTYGKCDDNEGRSYALCQADWVRPKLRTALALIHHKDARVVDEKGSDATRKWEEAAERGDLPDTRHYSIIFDPSKKVVKRAPQPESEGPAMPSHDVRGHWVEYGPEYGKGKLFGKLSGRFWVPAHARGSADTGEVVKDYKIKAPSEY
jgi:hypothetical protein